ncbi:hypothetical protein E2P86_17790 [Sphingobacterium psychroaquaticum]|uniref:hypothetical protein n=1 Tax=Sphingobacterium psychroaquaticum TaxID=561061 RepID=UPI00106A0687|nr:hypothetical protein [Sphingobacterium psychroaquaticum]QBQ42889.1 hypothetical protein E2P86_17790 [Sphingobacterium psychroaquaticum]
MLSILALGFALHQKEVFVRTAAHVDVPGTTHISKAADHLLTDALSSFMNSIIDDQNFPTAEEEWGKMLFVSITLLLSFAFLLQTEKPLRDDPQKGSVQLVLQPKYILYHSIKIPFLG